MHWHRNSKARGRDGCGGVVSVFAQTFWLSRQRCSTQQMARPWQKLVLLASISSVQFFALPVRSADNQGDDLVGKCFELKRATKGVVDSRSNICFEQKGLATVFDYGSGYGRSGEGTWRVSGGIVSIDADDVSVHEACKFQLIAMGKKLSLTCGWTGQWHRTK